MTDNFETATMAKLYMEQGHYDKAAKVYRSLLEKEPDRKDLQDALAAAETQLRASVAFSDQRLAELIGQWLELAIRYNRLKHLKKIQENLS